MMHDTKEINLYKTKERRVKEKKDMHYLACTQTRTIYNISHPTIEEIISGKLPVLGSARNADYKVDHPSIEDEHLAVYLNPVTHDIHLHAYEGVEVKRLSGLKKTVTDPYDFAVYQTIPVEAGETVALQIGDKFKAGDLDFILSIRKE